MQKIHSQLKTLRKTNPLIVNLTNFVSVQTVANVLLALGASPIMSQGIMELEELISLANALYINIGTLNEEFLQQAKKAQFAANKRQIPVVLDPVGAGATSYRTEAAQKILEQGVNIVRGNASEIIALSGEVIKTKGVDSTVAAEQAISSAKKLVEKYGITVVVSGEVDKIIDKKNHYSLFTGDVLMTKVTGLGCAASSVVAAFAAINPNFCESALAAMAVFGAAGKKAAESHPFPGSFYSALLDNLYQMDLKNLNQFARYEIV